MKKWIIAVFACILAGISAFSLYKNRTRESGTDEKPESVTLKWMLYGEKHKETDRVFSLFNEELQKYLPGVFVEFEVVDKDDYREKWAMKMATNERLDLAWFGNETLNYTEEVKKGSLMALDYLLKANGEELLRQIPQELWERQKRDGNIYGIPVEGPLYRRNYILVADKRLMERFGDMDEIIRINQENRHTNRECFAVFEDFLKQAKENNAIGTGVSYESMCRLADKGYEGIYGADSPFVISVFDTSLTVSNKYELDAYRSCFETMARWYRLGYIREDVMNLLDPDSEDGKRKGSILFLDEGEENGTEADVKYTEYEAVRGDLVGYHYISYDGCRNSLVIPKSAMYPQQAMELVSLLNSEKGKDLYRLLANGVEKQHYIIVEDNRIARMSDNDHSYLYQTAAGAIGNVFQNYETQEGEFERIRRYNDEAIISPLDGFNLDTRMIALEMAKVDLVVKQYKEELCRGTSENWEKLYEDFLNEMREAGSDKIVEEIQEQLDSFKKEKEENR